MYIRAVLKKIFFFLILKGFVQKKQPLVQRQRQNAVQQNGVVQGGAAAAVCRMRGGLVERCTSQVFPESLSCKYIAYCPLD